MCQDIITESHILVILTFTLHLLLLQFLPLREFLPVMESWLEFQPLLHLFTAVLALILLVTIAKAEA